MHEYKKIIWIIRTPKDLYVYRDFKKALKFIKDNIDKFTITIKQI